MTPENWPEAFGHSHSADGYQPLYTATQVREIVRMEVESAVEFIRAIERNPDEHRETREAARKWLKENKDAA